MKRHAIPPKDIEILDSDALLIVDVQEDFLPPHGALPVPRGNEVIPVLNQWIEAFSQRGRPIFASRDWHPRDHCSFKEYGGKWPPHCVEGSQGAKFPDSLHLPTDIQVISKGVTRERDAYSAFEGTGLLEILRQMGIKRLFVGGLATDYCVKATVLDALAHGFETFVLKDGVRGVDLAPGASEAALKEMEEKGATIL